MIKRDARIVESYNRSRVYSLSQCYGRFSSEKQSAWEYCQNLCRKKDGSGLKVISYNGWMFTAGFKYEENGKSYLMYITKSEDRPIELEDEI